MKRTLIGRGKNFSIAKAALIFFYEDPEFFQSYPVESKFMYTGDLDALHEIIDIAGAKHCSVFTKDQVMGCISNSPLWKRNGSIQGWQKGNYIQTYPGKNWVGLYIITPKSYEKETNTCDR